MDQRQWRIAGWRRVPSRADRYEHRLLRASSYRTPTRSSWRTCRECRRGRRTRCSASWWCSWSNLFIAVGYVGVVGVYAQIIGIDTPFDVIILCLYSNIVYFKILEIDSTISRLLIKEYKLYSLFESTIYQGVNTKYYYNKKGDNSKPGQCCCKKACRGQGNGDGDGECKRITLAIFQTGNRGLDRWSFYRTRNVLWDMKGLALNLAIFQIMCREPLGKIGSWGLILGLVFGESMLSNDLTYEKRRDAINQ